MNESTIAFTVIGGILSVFGYFMVAAYYHDRCATRWTRAKRNSATETYYEVRKNTALLWPYFVARRIVTGLYRNAPWREEVKLDRQIRKVQKDRRLLAKRAELAREQELYQQDFARYIDSGLY